MLFKMQSCPCLSITFSNIFNLQIRLEVDVGKVKRRIILMANVNIKTLSPPQGDGLIFSLIWIHLNSVFDVLSG